MAEAVHKTGNECWWTTTRKRPRCGSGVSAEAVRAEFKKIQSRNPKPELEDEANPASRSRNRDRPPRMNSSAQTISAARRIGRLGGVASGRELDFASARAANCHLTAGRADERNLEGSAAFLDECETPELRNLVTEAVAEDRKIPNPEQQLADDGLKLRNQFLDRQIGALTQKISQPEIPTR